MNAHTERVRKLCLELSDTIAKSDVPLLDMSTVIGVLIYDTAKQANQPVAAVASLAATAAIRFGRTLEKGKRP